MASLEQPRLKLNRAKEIWSTYQPELDDFFERHLLGVTFEFDTKSHWSSLHVKTADEVTSDHLALILGDALNNLRAALDYLAWQLVLAAGNTPDKKTSFPVALTEQAWLSAVGSKLSGVAPECIDTIRTFQPFISVEPKSHQLAMLDEMNNVLKHRLLPATLKQAHRFEIGELPVTPGVTYEFEHNEGPLSNGGAFFRMRGNDGLPIRFPPTLNSMMWRLGFDDGTGLQWDTQDMIDWVEHLLGTFESVFE